MTYTTAYSSLHPSGIRKRFTNVDIEAGSWVGGVP